jgi:hypothetical protein
MVVFERFWKYIQYSPHLCFDGSLWVFASSARYYHHFSSFITARISSSVCQQCRQNIMDKKYSVETVASRFNHGPSINKAFKISVLIRF